MRRSCTTILGLALKNQDDAAAAIPELETAEKLDPSQPEAPYLLGVLYLQAGRYDDAARELNLSLKLRPENGDGWATLGSVDNNLNKLQEAESALREAIKQLPQQPRSAPDAGGRLSEREPARRGDG